MRQLFFAAMISFVIGGIPIAQAKAAFCFEPRTPSLMFVSKPRKPFCAPRCSEWEVQQYKRELERYYDELEQYAADVKRFVRDANTYIECMADLD